MAIQEERLILKYADQPGYTNDIDCYLKHGGYDQLKKAVQMKPQAICKEGWIQACVVGGCRFSRRNEMEVFRPQVRQAHISYL